MKQELVSVAMCTYNGEKYLKEQLDSILNQTYTNLEVIICDDLSNDNTVKIINEYLHLDSRIKFYSNNENLGYLKNFEKAISLCTGEYIALSDQDDIWKKGKIETFLNEIQNNILIYSDAIIIDNESNETGANLVQPNRSLVSGKCNKSFLLENCVSGNTLMFQRELTKYILPIPNDISYHDIWIAFVASTIGKITYSDENLTYYRRYSEQVTHKDKVEYKNFFDKLNKREEIRIKENEVILKNLQVFSRLSILKQKEDIEIITLLIEHFSNYKDIFFNFRLFKILNNYHNEVFGIFKESRRKRKAFRTAVGLKLHKLSMFRL